MTGLTDFLRGSRVLTLLTVQLGYRTLTVLIWTQSKLQQLHRIWRQVARSLGECSLLGDAVSAVGIQHLYAPCPG